MYAYTAKKEKSMNVVTASEMREIDRETIQKMGIPSLVLMERAGLAVTSKIRKMYGQKKIIVISGNGNKKKVTMQIGGS